MKRLLIVPVVGLLLATSARADHIGIYSDQTGSSCLLIPGFSSTATVIHKYSAGTTGSLFSVSAANAPGSVIFALNSALGSVCVNPPCPYLYNGCVQSIVVGTITAMYGGTGYIEVVAASGHATIVAADCSEGQNAATGGRGYLGTAGDCEPLATESATWGKVKALYR